MEKVKTIIVGGGASGLFCALCLNDNDALVIEKCDRVGRKLSATGNGQGNLSNTTLSENDYFCEDRKKVATILNEFSPKVTLSKLEEKGGVFTADERGRVYPAGKQASAVTDLLRFSLTADGKKTVTGCAVKRIKKERSSFIVECEKDGQSLTFCSQNLVFATGGKAAKNFGTDGSAFEMIKTLGHTVTDLYPSLVQLKTDTRFIKGLKGIRVSACVKATTKRGEIAREEGDVIFTDYGVSGDAIFRISAFVTDRTDKVTLSIDFAPTISDEEILSSIRAKKKIGAYEANELLSGVLPSALGRAICRRAESANEREILKKVRSFTLEVTGSLGFDYAQVTKGGVPLGEVSDTLESKIVENLFITGEALDVDGKCGGYNLQWAFSSALAVATAINEK